MKPSSVTFFVWTVVILVCMSRPDSVQPQATPEGQLIFAFWPGQRGKQPDTPILDPVVEVRGGNFVEPLNYGKAQGEKAEAMYNAFVMSHFDKKHRYSLLFGGGELGSVEVQAPVQFTCESLTASATPSVSVPNGQKALAASSTHGLGLHPNWRQPNTTQQHNAFLDAATLYLKEQGVVGVSSSAIAIRNLRLTRLRANGPDALIGSVGYKGRGIGHNLFLVIEQEETKWRAVLASYHVTKDLEDYVDDVEEDFVDQLDLDSDGTDEIVTISYYYESWDYAIYKRKQGKWQQVYRGGGGGC